MAYTSSTNTTNKHTAHARYPPTLAKPPHARELHSPQAPATPRKSAARHTTAPHCTDRNSPIHQQPNPATPPAPHPHSEVERDFYHYHMIFKHIRPSTLQRMAKQNLVPNLPASLTKTPPRITYPSCAAAKLKPAPHKRAPHSYDTVEAMRSDICGPITPASRQGNRYILTVIDTNSRILIVDFLPTRQATPHRLDNILQHIKHSQHRTPRPLHTNNAKEYLSLDFKHVFNKHGTSHTTTTPYTPRRTEYPNVSTAR